MLHATTTLLRTSLHFPLLAGLHLSAGDSLCATVYHHDTSCCARCPPGGAVSDQRQLGRAPSTSPLNLTTGPLTPRGNVQGPRTSPSPFMSKDALWILCGVHRPRNPRWPDANQQRARRRGQQRSVARKMPASFRGNGEPEIGEETKSMWDLGSPCAAAGRWNTCGAADAAYGVHEAQSRTSSKQLRASRLESAKKDVSPPPPPPKPLGVRVSGVRAGCISEICFTPPRMARKSKHGWSSAVGGLL